MKRWLKRKLGIWYPADREDWAVTLALGLVGVGLSLEILYFLLAK